MERKDITKEIRILAEWYKEQFEFSKNPFDEKLMEKISKAEEKSQKSFDALVKELDEKDSEAYLKALEPFEKHAEGKSKLEKRDLEKILSLLARLDREHGTGDFAKAA